MSNFFTHPTVLALAEQLLDISGAPARPGRVIFCNSGAEANEAAFKMARLHRPAHGSIAAEGAFHGRTMGALALTGQPAKRAPFEPMPAGVEFVPYGDIDGAGSAPSTTTRRRGLPGADPGRGRRACPPPTATWPPPGRSPPNTARCWSSTRCRPASAAPGTGSPTSAPASCPDVITLAKGLGGGLPIGAAIGYRRRGAACCSPASTAPPSPATRSAPPPRWPCCDTIETDGLLDHVDALGKHIATGVEDLGHPLVDRVRGAGLLLGIVLTDGRRAGDALAARRRRVHHQRAGTRTCSGWRRR